MSCLVWWTISNDIIDRSRQYLIILTCWLMRFLQMRCISQLIDPHFWSHRALGGNFCFHCCVASPYPACFPPQHVQYPPFHQGQKKPSDAQLFIPLATNKQHHGWSNGPTSIHGSYQVATTQLTIAIFFPGIYLGGNLEMATYHQGGRLKAWCSNLEKSPVSWWEKNLDVILLRFFCEGFCFGYVGGVYPYICEKWTSVKKMIFKKSHPQKKNCKSVICNQMTDLLHCP